MKPRAVMKLANVCPFNAAAARHVVAVVRGSARAPLSVPPPVHNSCPGRARP